MKHLQLFSLGVLLLLGLMFYLKRVSPNGQALNTDHVVSKHIPVVNEGYSNGSSVLKSLQPGIESSRAANEELAARHAKHHEDLIRQRELEEKKNAEEAAYWESRQEWIEDFPFEPAYHPTITFDPDIYNPVGPGRPSDDTFEAQEMAKMIENHGFLSSFYENPKRYSPEFEKMYHILVEEGIQPDPMLYGWLFTHLVDYHKASGKDLSSPWPGNPDITWAEERNSTWESIAGLFQSNMVRLFTVDTFPTTEKVDDIRKRLIDEIKADGFMNVGSFERFVYDGDAEQSLKPGDPLLIQ